jgi:anti-anti-sigma factor
MEKNNVPEQTEDRIDFLELEMKQVGTAPGCLMVSMTGYIDTYNTPHFQRRVNHAIRQGSNRLVFDFSGITYISSAGIGAFTQFLKQVRPLGGDIVLVGLAGRVLEVFQLLGFANFFRMETSVDAAIADLKVRSAPGAERTLPVIFRCPICGKSLRTSRAGRFRCPDCKTILLIRENTEVSLG